MTDWYDRDGNPMPDNWWDSSYGNKWKGQRTDQRLANTKVGDHIVSTVWLGLDHSHTNGAPIIFETMVFGGEYEHELNRYATEEEALRGHLEVLNRLRADKPPFAHCETPHD